MPFPIRAATPADVPSLQVVRQQAIEAGFSAHYPRSAFADRVAAPDDRLPAWIESATATVLVAETDVTTVGFGAYDAERARVLALYTAPEYAGRGCASAILDRFEASRQRSDRGEGPAGGPRREPEPRRGPPGPPAEGRFMRHRPFGPAVHATPSVVRP